MSNKRIEIRRRPGERGQTIVLVAVALVSLLGMAALAIDVTTMYVARGEMQRAADAAALAGAKAFVDSGVTTDNSVTRQTLAQTMITSVVNSVLAQNNVSGAAPTLVAATPDFTRPGNPQILVTLQRTNLPTFFARIWGTKLVTVTATAVAEAYNPSSAPAGYPPIKPKCVKPLLVVNQDPTSSTPFLNPATGAPQAANVVGERITLVPACNKAGANTCSPANLTPNPPVNPPVSPENRLAYLAAAVTPNAANLCPACQGAPDFEQSIECCDFNPYACGSTPVKNAELDKNISHGQLRTRTNNGVQCLINGAAKDTMDLGSLNDLAVGTGPARITAGSGPQSGNLVTASRSIVNLPIIDSSGAIPNTAPGTPQVTVVGFLQVFIEDGQVAPGWKAGTGTETHITADILNVIGCGSNPGGGPPVSGGGMSAIPVRLIHQ